MSSLNTKIFSKKSPKNMRLHILFPFKESPWGGANQFLLALREKLRQQGNYRDEPVEAEALIANLNPGHLLALLKQVPQIKSRYPDKIIIARIDGPISLIRGRDDKLDRLLFKFIKLFADGIIYQSYWSKNENNKIVQSQAPYETVIHNATDQKIFYCKSHETPPRLLLPVPRSLGEVGSGEELEPAGINAPLDKGGLGRINIIATSWSPNIRKGFDIYQYLNQHLDFSHYSMTFVGNSPLKFKNIKHVKPLLSTKLASLLRQHDIYITASQNDPCSNALIEAISCGLPAVALNSGGHPELIRKGLPAGLAGGELFSSQSDIIPKINLVAQNLAAYQTNLPRFSITEVARKYLHFAQKIHQDIQQGTYHPKHTNLLTRIQTTKIRALYHL